MVGIQESNPECNQLEEGKELQSVELKESLQKNTSDAKVCSSLNVTEDEKRDKKVQELINGSQDTSA